MLRLPPCEARFPTSIAEAIDLKTKHGPEAAYVAGGTDLYPNMKRRQQTPYHLIDVRRIPELGRLEVDADGGIQVGTPGHIRGQGQGATVWSVGYADRDVARGDLCSPTRGRR